MDEKQTINFKSIIIWLLFLILSILLLVAISVDSQKIITDYDNIIQSGMSFLDVVKMNFPDVSNPIGPFGACMSYWLSYLFGRILCISLLLGMIMYSFFNIFTFTQENILSKTICFVVMAFFVNIIVITVTHKQPQIPGLFTSFFRTFLNNMFGTTGTIIIASVIIVVMVIIIFELGLIWRFFCWLAKIISSFFKMILKPKEKKIAKEKPVTKPRQPKLVIHSESIEDDDDDPQINLDIEELIQEVPKRVITPQINKTPPKKEEKKIIKQVKKRDNPNNYQPPADGKYHLPKISDFLQETSSQISDRKSIEENIAEVSNVLQNKLAEFQVEATVKNVNIGPIVTQYELEPAPGVKVNTFNNLSKDLALALKAKSLRVEAPIPGKGYIGIEVPNIQRDIIYLRDIMLSPQMKKMESKLAFALGKDISGNPVVADLARMPHLLIAGATGSGKSVCVNSIIVSLLLRSTPSELRLILIDPKRIELAGYEGIPHLIQNVVTETDHVMMALNWAVGEMERRYKLLQNYTVRNLEDYNSKIRELKSIGEEPEDDVLPCIVVIIDEFSDLIMTATKEIERPVTRLAQMARAIGIHLILATQRPSTKVITGLIKANFPARIAFKVSQKINSRVIMDSNGAEQLLGKGDSLYLGPGKAIPERIHGAYVSDDEINDLVDYLRVQPKPENDIIIIQEEGAALENFDFDDELFPEAAYAVVTAGAASVSMLQRHFKIGYARAGRLIDLLEQANIVGPHLGSKSREVLADLEDLARLGYLPEELS
ncbi:MAG: DNA translocase FtsK 4TM domain-containing protein [Candidatus Stygibacter frigidus]|nr:DNA translocase FtsK 4TM domain-containing protein [Candidatus Stygibacter frigidus]